MAENSGWWEAGARARASEGPAWLEKLRAAARRSFESQGFPTPRLEAWRYTNPAPLKKAAFASAEDLEPGHPQDEELAGYLLWDPEAIRLTFVDGHYAPHFSQLAGVPPGLRVGSMREVIDGGENLEGALGQAADHTAHSFVAMNTALFREGGYVRLEPGTHVEHPVHLLHISTRREPAAAHPRNLVVAGDGSQVTLVETYAGPEGGGYFTNAVTEVLLGANASVDHYKDQEESLEAYHLGFLGVKLSPDSRFRSHSLSLGARLGRTEIHARFDGPGADCELNGLYVAGGEQHTDHYTLVDHAVPQCTSRESFRGVLDGRSKGVFHGRVIVRPDAQKTEAHQQNKNLLLSDGATVDSKPQLEIFADDVRCTHGATIGQLEDDAVFYLRSRGISVAAARNMLTRAFASAVMEGVRVAPLRCRIDQLLFHQFEEPETVSPSEETVVA